MNADDVRSGLGEVFTYRSGSTIIRCTSIGKLVALRTAYHDRSDGEVRNEAAVHDVDVNPVGACRFDGPNLVREVAEIGGKNRRSNLDSVGRHLAFNYHGHRAVHGVFGPLVYSSSTCRWYPERPFADWPVQLDTPHGYVWYTDPGVMITQAHITHADLASVIPMSDYTDLFSSSSVTSSKNWADCSSFTTGGR